MPQSTLSMRVVASGPAQGVMFCVRVADCVLFQDQPPQHPVILRWSLDDHPGQHDLEFSLQGKNTQHTTMGPSGEILQDLLITVSDISINNIVLDSILPDLVTYEHDFNGHGPKTKEPWHGVMGCNGRAVLGFSTPAFLWLLEHT